MAVMHSRSKRAELKADAKDQGWPPRSRVSGTASRPSANPRISKGWFYKATVLLGCVLEFTIETSPPCEGLNVWLARDRFRQLEARTASRSNA